MRNLSILALVTLTIYPLYAAPDTVDSNFAETAGQVFDASSYGGIASVLVQPDGKIVFGSNEMSATVNGQPLSLPLIRFNPNGTVDETFFADNDPNGSDSGIYYDDPGMSEVHSLGISSDGKIIAAGVMQGVRTGPMTAPGVFLKSNSIVRFNSDGTIDTSFQTAGTTAWATGGLNFIRHVAVQPNNKIIVAGGFGGIRDHQSSPTQVRYGMARLNEDGSLDQGFQVDAGDFGVPAGAANIRARFQDADLDSSGRVLVVGEFQWGPAYPAAGTRAVFARLLPDGSLDSSFTPAVPAFVTNFSAVGVDPNGRVMVLGSNSNGSMSWLARFFADGSADTSFSLDPSLGFSVSARTLHADSQGRYLLATRSNANSFYNRLVRIEANGSLDPTFDASASYVNGPHGGSIGSFSNFITAPSGKIYSGSFFDRVNGISTTKLVAFEGDYVANAPGKIQFASSTFTATEQSGILRVGVTRTGGVSGAASATLSLAHGTTSSADLSLSSSTVTFADGFGGTQFVELVLAADGIPEADEMATLNLTGITGATAGSKLSATLTLIDSDSAPAIVHQPETLFVSPGSSFTLSVGISSGATPVSYQWFRNGTAIAGATSSRYAVAAADLALHEGSYTVSVANPKGTTTSNAAQVTVKNPAILRFTAATLSAVENQGTLQLKLQRGGSANGAVSVDVQLVGGTATAPDHFLPLTQTVSWADGDSADQTVTVTLVNNALAEPAKHFQAILVNPSLDVVLGTPSATAITLLDDDSGPTISSPLAALRVVNGWNAALAVEVQSQTAVSYQWFKEGIALPGETAASLSFAPVTLADYGYYSVNITNTAGTVTSGPVEFGARPNPLDRVNLDMTIGSTQFAGISARPHGGYLVFGSFNSLPTSGGQVAATRLARVGPDGKVDPSFLPAMNNTVAQAIELNDGSVIAQGTFSAVGVVPVDNGFVRLLSDGSVDQNFLANLPAGIGIIRDIEVSSDGQLYLTHSNGVDRLQADGTPDLAFRASVLSGFQNGGTYNNLEFATDGGFYLSGNLQIANPPSGSAYRRLVRLNANGTNDTTWKYTASGTLTNFGVQADGKPIVPGNPTVRLNTDGSVDPTFTSIVGIYNNLFAVASDDSIYSASGASSNSKLRHHHADGTLDTNFNNGVDPAFNNTISSITALSDGTIAVHGSFSTVNGTATARPYLLTGNHRGISILSQPLSQSVNPGASASLQVVASSASNLTYQWQKNGTDLLGETRALLSLANVTAADTGAYSVKIASASRSVISDAAQFMVRDQPMVLAMPADGTYLDGQPLALTVDWVGLEPATFKWFRNGSLVSGQTSNVLNFASATAANSGVYTLQITNALGTVTTVPVVVNVVRAPGALAAGYIPPTGGTPSVTQILPDILGAIVRTGTYGNVIHPSGTYRLLERVFENGNIATPFSATINSNVTSIVRDPVSGDLFLIGSNFVLNGTGGRRVARMSASGVEDTSYTTNAHNAAVAANLNPQHQALDDAGRWYLGAYGKLIRLLPDGTIDNSFSANISGSNPTRVVALPNGEVIVVYASSVVKHLTTGALDTSFSLTAPTGANNLRDLEVTPSGELWLPDPQNNQAIYRYSPNGALLQRIEFPKATYGSINHFIRLKNGSLLVAHQNGKRLTRLLPDGTVDPLFDISTGFNAAISCLVQDTDGSLWIGGSFNQFRGSPAYAMVRLNGDPADVLVTTQPADVTVDQLATAQFSVVGVTPGGTGIAYQWRKHGVALTNGGDISGATSATLSIANADQADEGQYDVILINQVTGRPAVSGTVELTVLREPETLALTGPQQLEVGQALTLSVEARGAGEIGYQWFYNGQAIVGANDASFTIATSEVSNSGVYTVETTNAYGTLVSAPIPVVVNLPAGGILFGSSNLSFGGDVHTILPLPDGRTLIGGAFTSIYISPTSYPVTRLALLDADGDLVASFKPNVNGIVTDLKLMPDGGVLMVGYFSQVEGVNRGRIARLNPDLTHDATWNAGAGANNPITNVEASGSGYYITGTFGSYNGNTGYSRLCHIHEDGSLDTSFNPPVITNINRMRRDGDGVVVVGNFSILNSVTGITQTGMARLLATGELDTSFVSSVGNSVTVADVVALPDGKWLVGGIGSGSYRFARFFADGTKDPSWLTFANNDIRSLAVQPDGKILVGGNFTVLAGQSVNRFARLNADGTLDNTFAQGSGANGVVQAIAIDALGAIHIGGSFSTYRDEQRGRYARLNGDPLTIGIAQSPSDQVVEPDSIVTFNVTVRATDNISYQWRKNGTVLADGGRISGTTTATLVISDVEEIDEASYDVIATHYGNAATAQSRPALLTVLGAPEILQAPVAVEAETGMEASFRVVARGVGPLSYQWYRANIALTNGSDISGANSDTLTLSSLVTTDSGPIHVRVSNVLGNSASTPVPLLVKHLPEGRDRSAALPLGLSGEVFDILFDDDGSYLIGGSFSSIGVPNGTATRRCLAKFDVNGVLNTTTVQVNGNGFVEAIAKAADGKIYIVGGFISINTGSGNVARSRVARLNSDLSLDTTFNPVGSGPNGVVKVILPQADGKILIAGEFSNVNNVAGTGYIARLDASGTVDTTFVSQASTYVRDIAPAGDGTFWIAHSNNYAGQQRVIRIDATGAVVSGYQHTGSMTTDRLLPQADGSVITLGTGYPYLKKTQFDGTQITTWPNAGGFIPGGAVTAGCTLPEGQSVIGGAFTTYAGTARKGLALIEEDGSLNTDFDPREGLNGAVHRIRVDASGRIWVLGAFSQYRGEAVPRMVVLNGFSSVGTQDDYADFVAGLPEDQRGESDDPDQDGVPNLIEFAYGSAPGVFTPSPVSHSTSTALGSALSANLDPNKHFLVVVIETPKDTKGVSLTLGATVDLSFTDGATATEFGNRTDQGATELRRYYLTPATDDAATLFWRMEGSR